MTEAEADWVMRLDCALGLQTMGLMMGVLTDVRDARGFELIIRAVCGFAATAMMSIRKGVDDDRPAGELPLTTEERSELMQVWWQGAGRRIMEDAIAAEIQRVAAIATSVAEVEAAVAVKH
jgi:hypothetical protein